VNGPDPFEGKADYFDGHYRSTRGRTRLRLVLERLETMLPPPPSTVLDVGGGTGAFAVPLALRGHRVTVVDPSEDMLRVARENADRAGATVQVVPGPVERVLDLVSGPFHAILFHAVLLYVEDPERRLADARALAEDGAALSLLEKNRDALAMRPGLGGEYPRALRLLDERVDAGGLGIENTSRSVEEWVASLRATGWEPIDWVGVRLFSDRAPDELRPSDFETLLDLERAAGRRDPYRRVARLVHLHASAVSRPPGPG
jgi:S-adenosylmethionine-dependent methyltransferase